MNDNGQAYSTFKLLIAAIVALAILMILLPIISSVLIIFQNDPTDKVIELLNDLHNKPEAIKTTPDVAFKPDYVISASTFAERVPLSSNQTCMSLGDYEENEDSGFELLTEGHHRIIWHGSSDKTVKIVVTCNIDLELLETGLRGTVFDQRNWDYDCDVCEGQGKCCLIALKTP